MYPSTIKTVSVKDDPNYGGAHVYHIHNCLGFVNGETRYHETKQEIRFVQVTDAGEIIPGLQTEQVLIMLIDRQQKLNDRFPSPENAGVIEGLEKALAGLKARVDDRLQRGVMGTLTK